MGKRVSVKIRINKANGQMNFSLPKRQFSKKTLSDISKCKRMEISIDKLI